MQSLHLKFDNKSFLMSENNNPFINVKSIHFLGWVSYFALLTISYSSVNGLEVALLKAAQTITVHIALFYMNSLIIMPRLMKNGKYVLYFLAVIGLIILGAFALYYLNVHLKPFGNLVHEFDSHRPRNPARIRGEGRKQISETMFLTRGLIRNALSITIVVLLSIVSKLFSQRLAKEKREESLQKEQLLSEMKFLKSQVNPHFLFNALNNIYALVYTKNDLAPGMLMKLSDMLRYMIYECNEEKVLLKKEIKYITNFIELQQLKTEKKQNIQIDFENAEYSLKVPPLMLIPFIENSFKHSNIENAENSWVKMKLVTNKKDEMLFSISNSKPALSLSKDGTGGIGLENVRRRLELLYPDKHTLDIRNTKNEFIVNLKINIA